MRATTLDHTLSMVFLNSVGTLTRFADAKRVREHLERHPNRPLRSSGNVVSASKASP